VFSRKHYQGKHIYLQIYQWRTPIKIKELLEACFEISLLQKLNFPNFKIEQ
jgi:hypothetical protein